MVLEACTKPFLRLAN